MNTSVDSVGVVPRQEDFDAIRSTTLDYVDGWYNGDAERMRRSLHPDLMKRTVVRESKGRKWQLRRPTTAEMMVRFTEEGGGAELPEPERVYQITIVDIFRHIAMVKCVSPDFVDYIQLANIDDGGWVIVNVLFELREGEFEPAS